MRQDYRLGMLEGGLREKLEAVVELFGEAGLEADLKENIIEWLWVHHAINAGLIGAALYAGGIRELVTSPALMIFTVYAVRDSLEVLKARGVDVTKYPDTKPYFQERVDEFTANYANSILNTRYGQRVMKAGHFGGSPAEMKRFYFGVLGSVAVACLYLRNH